MKLFRTFYFVVSIFSSLVVGVPFFGNDCSATELKLLTLNIHQFPYGIVTDHNLDRAKRLAQIVNERNAEFDVIAFQELWSNKTRRVIREKIQAFYPYRFEDNQWGAYGLGFHSGLAFYSKYPIKKTVQHTYQSYRGPEDLAKKGLMGVELEVEGIRVYVFTTHLQAGPGGSCFKFLDGDKPPTSTIIRLQLAEARKVIDKFVKDKNAPVFLIGDLNMRAGGEVAQNGMIALGNAHDSFDPTLSKSSSVWNDSSGKHRIDYILTLDYPVAGYSRIVDLF